MPEGRMIRGTACTKTNTAPPYATAHFVRVTTALLRATAQAPPGATHHGSTYWPIGKEAWSQSRDGLYRLGAVCGLVNRGNVVTAGHKKPNVCGQRLIRLGLSLTATHPCTFVI